MRIQASVLVVQLIWQVGFLRASDWPQWRGPERDGTWLDAGPDIALPSAGSQPIWQMPLGGGYGGIAVQGTRLFVMDRQTKPSEVERVCCFDSMTGKLIWSQSYAVDYKKMDYGNGPRATPTVHQGKVYTLGAVGHVHCFDAATGHRVWSHDTVRDLRARIPMWGHSCSPLVDGDRVILQVGGEEESSLVAYHRLSGKILWTCLADRPGYSSPVLVKAKTGTILVYWTPQNIVGLERKTGKVLWRIPYASTYDVSICDPVWHDDVLFVSGYWEGTKALQLDAAGRNPRILWEGRKVSMLMSTPLYRNGHIYALDKRDGLKCIEARTGKVMWEGHHVTPRGRNPHATLVWAGRRALILNELGELILAELSPDKYFEVGKVKILKDGTWAHPAFAGGRVYARNDSQLVCYPLGQ